MEYNNESDLGVRHCIGLPAPRRTVKDRRAVKGQSNGLCAGSAENQLCHQNTSSNAEIIHALGDQSISRRHDSRRASSSHGPIGVISSSVGRTNDSFFEMLQDYQPAVLGVIGTDQRSPGPAEFMQGRSIHATSSLTKITERNANQTDSNSLNVKKTRDPKVKNKLHRFLVQSKNKTDDNVAGLSLLTKNCSINEDLPTQYYSTTPHTLSCADIEEQQRQRVFAHYDCQSLVANLNYVKKLKGRLVAKASNNSTGSSTASAKTSKEVMPDIGSKNPALEFTDCNGLLENCPYFCSETGRDNERDFNFTGLTSSKRNGSLPRAAHTQVVSYSVSILESLPSETLWQVGACPFQNDICSIEAVDHGAHYYRRYFYSQKHENWFGIDEQLGPLAISIKKEKLHDSGNEQRLQQPRYQFRIIIRTSELLTLRGIVIEDSISNPRGSGKSVSSKELLEYVAPEIQINCLRLGVSASNCEQQLLKLDEQGLTSKYKVGILYCRSGQTSEEDMYNNEDAGPAFIEFLETIGKRVRLKGFQHYKAGLDNKTDSTGTHSVYAVYKDCEVMFHVCTMLPFTPNNRQQLLRKRHIGNDIVTIIFQEPGALPFTPKNIRSQFQHVFLIVRAINPCTDNTAYRIAISRSKEVPVFGPPLPAGAIFHRNRMFAEFILAKTINAENAAHRSEKFANLATRTRKEYLKDLCINYCTNLYIDPGNKFSIFPSKKKDKPKMRFSGDISQRGAICWQILLQDHGSSMTAECFLGISVETFVIIEEHSKQIIFVTPTRSILGWYTAENSLRIFYHNGECITITMRYFGGMDEQLEVIERLRAVTLGNGVRELGITRNMMGQLGFHVQPDGIVTQVDATGQAWAAGLRRGYRLVEVCKIVLASLSYGEMIDLLKTSAQLTFIVIKSFSDSTPRRGCFNEHCKINFLSLENDHEAYGSSNSFLETDSLKVKSTLRKEAIQKFQHPVLNYKYCYEQNFLPNKSTSGRSGYQTGSSSVSSSEQSDDYKKSMHAANLYSPHSCNNDKWYDILEDAEQKQNTQNITLSLRHQYTVKSCDHPKLEESTSLPLSLTHSSLFHNDCSKTQASLLNDKSNFTQQSLLSNVEFSIGKPPSDTHKIIKHRCSKYEITELKCVTISPSESCTTDITLRNHNQPLDTPNVFGEKTTSNSNPTYKCSISNVQKIDLRGPVLPCSSTVKTAKLLPSMPNCNPMNNIQRNMGNYSKTNTFRRDLLEIISPNCSSHYDSLIAKRNSTVERIPPNPQVIENVSAFITSDLKQPGMQQTFEGANKSVQISFTSSRPATILSQINSTDDSCKPFGQHFLRVSESSTRLKESMEVSRRNVRNDLLATPPLLPDTKELDWTTLVDTATKAIILQLRDDNSCKPLSLCNNIDDIKNDTGSNLQETSDAFPLQFNCASELKSHLSNLENRILRETRYRKSLEYTILRLSEENRRLQDESQAALQQLQSFTDWFYRTIARKT